MKKSVRKFLSFATAVCVVCSVLSVGTPLKLTVSAASESDLTFELNDDGVSYYVASCDGNASGDLIIPSTYNLLPVTGIGDYAFDLCRRLESITIPDSVTSIGLRAFSECRDLESVTIPDSVTGIGANAFSQCETLRSVTIPDSVTSIGLSAFENCGNLQSITLPNGVTSIEDRTFGGCRNLTSVTIPDSVTSIGIRAFDYCESLTSVTIPDSVTSISNCAFQGCKLLTSVTIPDSVTSIGIRAFEYCKSLTSVTISDSVTGIGMYAFDDTAYYNNADNWENGVLYIGNHLIAAKTTISGGCVIKAGTKTIVDSAFQNCESLISVTIPDSVRSISDYAFRYCRGLTTVAIGSGVTSIGEDAFIACTSLGTITIPDSVTSINKDAFNNTAYYNNENNWENDVLYIGNHLIKAKNTISGDYVVKDSTKTIADEAFYGCSGLDSVTVGGRVTNIGDSAFKNSPNVTIRCYSGSYAQTYAEKNKIKYSLLELVPIGKTFVSSSSNRIFTEQSGKNTVEEIVTSENYSVIAIPSFVNGTANYYGTGSAIGFLKNGALEFIYKLVVYGDLNGDSTVDALDVAIAEKVASKKLNLDGDFLLAADFDNSGDVSVTDYQQVVNSALK